MEALMSCMITEGPPANRPPHCMLAGLSGGAGVSVTGKVPAR